MAENVAAGVVRLVFVDIASLVCIAIPLAWLWYTSVSAEANEIRSALRQHLNYRMASLEEQSETTCCVEEREVLPGVG
jgi:hypothetical protein